MAIAEDMEHLMEMTRRAATIDYTNWRGERRTRRILPVSIVFDANEWHKEPCWMLMAHDVETPDWPVKSFALSGIHSFSAK